MSSIKVRRNISAVLTGVGAICAISRIWNVVMDPHSSRVWFELFGAIIITYLSFDSWWIYRRKLSAQKSKTIRDGK